MCPAPAEFLSDFSELGWTQLIKGPTRTTETGGKTLDLLLTDVQQEIFTLTEVVSGVSDHDALLVKLALNVVRPMRPPKTDFNNNRANWEQLNLDLAQRLPQNFSEMNINTAWEQWKAIFFYCLHKNVPTKTIKDKVKSPPWLDIGLRKMMAARDKLFAKWHKNPSHDTARELYCTERNATQRALRHAKDGVHEETWHRTTGLQILLELYKRAQQSANPQHDEKSLNKTIFKKFQKKIGKF
jgi:hypothetical protein